MYLNLIFSRKFSNLGQTRFSPSIQSHLKALVQQGQYSEALISYTEEPHFPLNATKFTFPSLLKACAALSNLYYGKTLHATINTLGFRYDPYVITSLINMYVKCGSFTSAVQLFDDMSERDGLVRDVTVWNSMIDGYFKYGLIYEGALQFCRMQVSGVKPDGYTLSILIGECRKLLGYLGGKQVHAYVVRNMFDDDPFVVTALIDMYASCGRPIQGWRVFEMLGDKDNVVAWNAIISGFCENGLWENSLELYMLAKNENCILGSATFSSTLTACSRGEDLGCGMQIHCDVMKLGFEGDPYVGTSLLTMYAKGGLVEDAEKVFDAKLNKEVEIWNAMISAYGGKGCASDALNVYLQMKVEAVSSDCFTIRNLLASCSMLQLYGFGRALHGEVIKRPMQSDVTVQSALLTMYSKCGRMEDASAVFSTMRERDVVAWGSLISGFCQNRKFREALYLFKVMEADGEKPDSDIMVSVTIASTGLENVGLSRGVHGFVIKNGLEWNAFVGSLLIDMYSHYRCPIMARDVSLDIPHKNLVVWNSLISCYSQNGLPELSIGLLPQITHNGLYPDPISITGVLTAVSSMAVLLKGKAIHGFGIRVEILSDVQVENALIDMYLKCGSLKYAQHVFQSVSRRNLVTWNTMISGYGSHGECQRAISLFNEMGSSGIVPDDLTFLSLISSCNHSGLVNDGLSLFQLMKEYRIEPRMEHYVNIVDLLGRAGCLADAYDVIQAMPIEPDQSVWLCLLSACRVHRNIELGELAADNLLKIDSTRGSNYVQLLNLYVEAGLREKAANLRASMKQKGLKKSPGCSWIEVRNKVDTFFSGDSSSPRTVEIYETLSGLRGNMIKRRGCDEALECF